MSALLIAFLFFATPPPEWTPVAQALGRAGAVQPDGVYKAAFPRTDLTVRVDGVTLRPALALGSWVAFHESMMMGDLVLLEGEVDGVIDALHAGGVEVTALHNHLLRESPRIMYLHFDGHGDPVALAKTLHAALATTKTPIAAAPAPATAPALDLPAAELDRIIGRAGKANGGVYQFAVPRKTSSLPASMGMATAINMQAAGEGRAVTTGDFVMIASEVDGVMRALRGGGIEITALHSHMLDEQPRLFFMHFWGNGDPLKLAKTLRAALDKTERAP